MCQEASEIGGTIRGRMRSDGDDGSLPSCSDNKLFVEGAGGGWGGLGVVDVAEEIFPAGIWKEIGKQLLLVLMEWVFIEL